MLRFKVLRLHTIFGVFSNKIFFLPKFSSFEGVNLGFLKNFCQKISEDWNLPLSPPEGKGTLMPLSVE